MQKLRALFKNYLLEIDDLQKCQTVVCDKIEILEITLVNSILIFSLRLIKKKNRCLRKPIDIHCKSLPMLCELEKNIYSIIKFS